LVSKDDRKNQAEGASILWPPVKLYDNPSPEIDQTEMILNQDIQKLGKGSLVLVIGTSLSKNVNSTTRIIKDLHRVGATLVSVNAATVIGLSSLFEYKFTCTANNFARELTSVLEDFGPNKKRRATV
jgi:NAD-dependent SIR2 family protein deacetylase